MRRSLPGILIALLLLARPASAQESKSPAELLPANTIGYVELRQPGAIVKEIASLFQGSVLGNMPDSFAKFREKYDVSMFRTGTTELAVAGVLNSPELVNEISRIQGFAIGITGIDKEDKHMPEFVGILLPGDSNLPGFLFRMFLAAYHEDRNSFDGKVRTQMLTSMEPVGECEGVRLYRAVRRRTTTGQGQEGAKPVVEQQGPALARLPSGVILVGTPERVKDVIRKANARGGNEPSLADNRGYQEARKRLGDTPGFFSYGNLAPLPGILEQVLPDQERRVFLAVRDLVNLKAFAGVATSLTLENGTLSYRWLAQLDPNEKTPILDVFADAPLKTELLHFAPRDALLVAALSNAEGERRWERLVQLADNVAKAVAPNVPPPSQMIAGGEEFVKLKIGKDLFGQIEAVALAVPGAERLQQMAKGPQTVPAVVIVRAPDAEAAGRLTKEVLPKIVGTATFQFNVKPTEREVNGHTVTALSLGGNAPKLYFGRHEATVVLGADEALVAESLAAGAKRQGFVNERNAAALKRAGEPVVLVIAKPLTLAGLATAVYIREEKPAAPPGATPPPAPAPAAPDPILQGILQLAQSEEPLVISLQRKPDHLLFEASYTGLRTLVPKATDFFVELALRSSSSAGATFAPPRAVPAATPKGQ